MAFFTHASNCTYPNINRTYKSMIQTNLTLTPLKLGESNAPLDVNISNLDIQNALILLRNGNNSVSVERQSMIANFTRKCYRVYSFDMPVSLFIVLDFIFASTRSPRKQAVLLKIYAITINAKADAWIELSRPLKLIPERDDSVSIQISLCVNFVTLCYNKNSSLIKKLCYVETVKLSIAPVYYSYIISK